MKGLLRRSSPAAPAALLLLACVSGGGHLHAQGAPDPGLDQAVRNWLGCPGTAAPGAAPLFRSVPEGNHVRLTLSLAPLARPGVSVSGGDVTLSAQREGDGRWHLFDVFVPTSIEVTRTVPGEPRPRRVAVRADRTTADAVIDPTGELPSFTTVNTRAMTIDVASPALTGTATVGQWVRTQVVAATTTGAGVERLVRDGASNISGRLSRARAANIPVGFTVGRADVETRQHSAMLNGLPPADAPNVPPALLIAITAGLNQGAVDPVATRTGGLSAFLPVLNQLTPPDTSEAARVLLSTLRFSVFNQTFATASLEVAVSLGAPGGNIDSRIRFDMGGIERIVPAPTVRDPLLPRRVLFALHASGLPLRETRDLLQEWDNTGAPKAGRPAQMLAQDTQILLDKGPLVVALDDLLAEIGPAQLTGTGSARWLRLAQWEGEFTFHVTGLDALIASVQTRPKQTPFLASLFYLKGLSEKRADGASEWRLGFGPGYLLVNGLPVSAHPAGYPKRPLTPTGP